ncbi:MAG: DUF2281 domain-containing protein [Woronichinia naegeliana WA131]|jgi:hypothetical protein|uniref:DUF2281 domain-containing protein n=1 Tax=Woronichinia naegeliana WA131 TaxID=2824559 RepID=A0A977L296_9CYAN|nr:MAG: DUF2281 domain-containing protein [Woronichinia naegeliana WA131]
MTVLEIAMQKMQYLPQQKQQEVLDFIEFLASKSGTESTEMIPNNIEKESISARDVLNKWAGIMEDGPADLSTNPKYMEGYGQA